MRKNFYWQSCIKLHAIDCAPPPLLRSSPAKLLPSKSYHFENIPPLPNWPSPVALNVLSNDDAPSMGSFDEQNHWLFEMIAEPHFGCCYRSVNRIWIMSSFSSKNNRRFLLDWSQLNMIAYENLIALFSQAIEKHLPVQKLNVIQMQGKSSQQ